MGCIYKLTFNSGKSYIGQSMRALNIRINAHRTAAARGSMLPVHCAWRAHGEPSIEVVCEVDTQDDLHDAEIALIASLGTLSPSGYNVSRGGDTAPSKNPEVAAKIAAKAIGRKWSEEKKLQLSDALRVRWQSEEYQAKVSAGLRESFASPEAKEKLSKRSVKAWQERKESGWTMPESTKEKMRGKVFTEETRAKMSAAAKGRPKAPRSVETRAKLSASSKAAGQDPELMKARGEKIREALALKHDVLSAAAKKRWASKTPEERAQVGAAISAALRDKNSISRGAA